MAGGGQVTISVPITNDDLFEGAQSFTLNITKIAKAANTTASAPGNITDNDPAPVVSVTPTSTSVTEGNPVSVTLSMANKSETAVTVNFAKQNQTAGDSDYTLASGSRTWNAGETGDKPAIQATAANDSLDEDDETFRINFTSAAQLSNAFAQVTITDNNGPVKVNTVTDATVTEGNTGTVDVSITVTLSAASGKRVTVPYSTAPDHSDRGNGLRGQVRRLHLRSGGHKRVRGLQGQWRHALRGDEKFSVVLTTPTNADAGSDMRGEITITDDDNTPIPTLSSPSVNEGNSGLIDLVFEATLAAPHPAVSFNYRTVNDTANASDFEAASGSKLFPANSGTTATKVPITIKVKGDLLDELDETLKLELLNNNDVVVRSATGTIKNDDNNSKLSISDATADEPGTMKFTVTLAPASGRDVKVNWGTADGTATAPGDYTSGSGQLTFAPGETTKTIDIAVAGDTTNEENETLKVNLSNPIGVPLANLVDEVGDGTIVDKNAPPSLSISDTTTREGVGADFVVTLAGTTLRTVTVRFNTADGTAQAGSDYSARVGSLTFAPGEKTKTITVTVLDDAAAESVEEFSVVLGDPVNATITKARGVATIEASDRSLDPPTIVTPGTTPPTGTPQNQPNTTTKQLVPRMILGPRTVMVGVNGLAKMQVNCQRVSPIVCAGSVELQRAAKPLLTLGKKTFSVKKGTKAFASIKLSARTLSILRKSKTMRVKVTVLVKTNTKTIKATPGTITLKATTALIKSKPAPAPTKVVVDP